MIDVPGCPSTPLTTLPLTMTGVGLELVVNRGCSRASRTHHIRYSPAIQKWVLYSSGGFSRQKWPDPSHMLMKPSGSGADPSQIRGVPTSGSGGGGTVGTGG